MKLQSRRRTLVSPGDTPANLLSIQDASSVHTRIGGGSALRTLVTDPHRLCQRITNSPKRHAVSFWAPRSSALSDPAGTFPPGQGRDAHSHLHVSHGPQQNTHPPRTGRAGQLLPPVRGEQDSSLATVSLRLSDWASLVKSHLGEERM